MISDVIDQEQYDDSRITVFMGGEFTRMPFDFYASITKFVQWELTWKQFVPPTDPAQTRNTFCIAP